MRTRVTSNQTALVGVLAAVLPLSALASAPVASAVDDPSWSTPATLSNTSVDRQVLASTPDGRTHVAAWSVDEWTEGISYRVSRDSGRTWDARRTARLPSGYYYVESAVMSDDGKAMSIAFRQWDGIEWSVGAISTADSGATWGDGALLGLPGQPAQDIRLAGSASGESLYAVWQQSNNSDESSEVRLSVSGDGGLSWTASRALSAPGEFSFDGLVTTSDSGQFATSAWSECTSGQVSICSIVTSSSSNYGQTWTTAKKIATGDSGGADAELTLNSLDSSDSGRVVALAWTDAARTPVQVSSAVSRDQGLLWSTSLRFGVPDAENTTAKIRVSGDGSSMAIAWHKATSYFESRQVMVRQSNDVGQSWSPTIAVSPWSTEDAGDPRLAISESGEVTRIAWGLSYETSSGNSGTWGGIQSRVSTDSGRTWSAIEDVYGISGFQTSAVDLSMSDDGASSLLLWHEGQSIPGLRSSASAPVGAPSPPLEVTANPSDRAADVQWRAPTSDGGAPVTAFTVTASPGGQQCSTSGALRCTVSGLTNGQVYTFTVTASNSAGTSAASEASRPIIPQVPVSRPGKVTSIKAVGLKGKVKVTWQPPTDVGASDQVTYQYQANKGIWKSTSKNRVTIKGIKGKKITVKVRAVNAAGFGQAVRTSATPK